MLQKLIRWLKMPYRTEHLGHYHEEDGHIVNFGLQYTRLDVLIRFLVGIVIIISVVGSFSVLLVLCLNP